MKIKDLKKGKFFKPHLGKYEGQWVPPTWQKIEYDRKKRGWICYEVEGKRIAYFYPQEEIKEVYL